jgi:hypothetical protein
MVLGDRRSALLNSGDLKYYVPNQVNTCSSSNDRISPGHRVRPDRGETPTAGASTELGR